MTAELIGTIAGTCTTVAFLPQVIMVYRTKSTAGISLSMYIVFSTGVLFWTCYGVATKSAPVIIANGITFLLSMYILLMKIKHK